MRHNQRGFSVIEIGIVVVIVAIIGTVGTIAYQKIQTKSEPKLTSSQATNQKDEESKTTVTTPKDLVKVSDQLDNLPIDDNDNSTLDSTTNNF